MDSHQGKEEEQKRLSYFKGVQTGKSQEKRMLTEGQAKQKPYSVCTMRGTFFFSPLSHLQHQSFTFHPQRALSAAGGASHPSWVACWWIRP